MYQRHTLQYWISKASSTATFHRQRLLHLDPYRKNHRKSHKQIHLCPLNFSSDSKPKYLAVDPVAMINASDVYFAFPPFRTKGLDPSSALSIWSYIISVSNLFACSSIDPLAQCQQALRIAEPILNIRRSHDCPPGSDPVIMTGLRLARAANSRRIACYCRSNMISFMMY